MTENKALFVKFAIDVLIFHDFKLLQSNIIKNQFRIP